MIELVQRTSGFFFSKRVLNAIMLLIRTQPSVVETCRWCDTSRHQFWIGLWTSLPLCLFCQCVLKVDMVYFTRVCFPVWVRVVEAFIFPSFGTQIVPNQLWKPAVNNKYMNPLDPILSPIHSQKWSNLMRDRDM